MKEHSRHMRTIMRLILFAVCANAAVQHLDVVAHAIGDLLGVAAPILLGLFAAFILTIPINALERHLIRPHGKRALTLQKKLQRPLSIALSIILIVAAIAFVSIAVIPNLVSSLHSMIADLPALLEQFKEASLPFKEQAPELVARIQNLSFDALGFESALSAILTRNTDSVADAVVAVATSVFGKALSAMLGLIIAISAACQKERLAAQAIRFVQTFFAKNKAEKMIGLVRRVRNIFANFITGQVLEAIVLGAMVFAGMLIFRFPHAFSISALAMVMALIPILGAWISAIVGAILVLASDGLIRAVGFVLLIIILQQIEGNIIYPRVMGNRVGLPSLWVLAAITLCSALMGIWGMLLFVPLFAVVYQLTRDQMHSRQEMQSAH
ncbi:MAG: AI-2E family transporter [Candidatus Faecivicinus sp.]